MPYKRILLLVGLALALFGTLTAQALFPKPLKVLGDPQFVGTAGNPTQFTTTGPNWVEGRELNSPLGVALDMSVTPPNVYIADAGNNRVLGFQYATQLKPGAPADVVIGQVDGIANRSSALNGRSTTGLNLPSGLAVDAAGNLYIADTNNNRIVRYPKPLSQPAGQQIPDLVIGQTNSSGRTANAGGLTATALNTAGFPRAGIVFDAQGNLWAADPGNNRVLRFPAVVLKAGLNGPAADLVVGQNDFTSRLQVQIPTSKTGLSGPVGVGFDSAGRLLVSEVNLGGRLLVYAPGIGNSGVATRILGLDGTPGAGPASQLALNNVVAAVGIGSGLVVAADALNNRLLVYPAFESWAQETVMVPSPTAMSVIGQTSFTLRKPNQGTGDASASSFTTPVDLAFSGTELFVADRDNNRVLVFPAGSSLAMAATRVIGQLDFPYTAPNLIEGKEFSFAPAGGLSGSAILDQSSSPRHLYVADTQNNRVLGFRDYNAAQNGQKADLVIGQPDLLRQVVNYPTGDPTTPNAQGLRLPTGLTVDSAGNLYVTDTGNSRVLRFPAPFASGKTTLETADLVLGQTTFTSIVTDPSERNMGAPVSVALTADAANNALPSGGWLVACDALHNRVLFFPKPFSNGMSATKVLGALTFTSAAANGNSDPARFFSPRGVAVDPQDRVIVADSSNRRVQIFNRAAQINNNDTPPVSLTGFAQPVSVSANAGGFWVADTGQNALQHYPPYDQLLLKSNASDSSLPAVAPVSAFTDMYNNLLVGDAINRVLYFAPQLDVVNAANYSTRPLAAGTIAAVFPHTVIGQAVANVIGGPTVAATVTPLPNTLSDTQFLVNGKPAPLFFVSPGQINAVLPNNLPTGGTADVMTIRPSTGQIFGGAEVALASASPAFFTPNQAGTGQIIAVNIIDNTLNTASNPVARGQFITLYGTGLGPVANAPPDGTPPTGATPGPVNPQVLIGAAKAFLPDANVQYSGLNPFLVGVWQLNLQIPMDAVPGGSVPVKVFMNSIPSVDPTTNAVTTIGIK